MLLKLLRTIKWLSLTSFHVIGFVVVSWYLTFQSIDKYGFILIFLQTKVVHQRQKLFCAFVPTKSHPLIIHCYGPKTNLSISILQIKDYLMFLSLSNRERIDFLLTLHSTSASMIENWTANIFKRPKISKNTNLYVYVAFQRHMITWSKCLWYDDKIFSSKN